MWFSSRIVLILIIPLQLFACSSDSVKRNTYQSLQIMQQRECQQQPGKDCPQPESYDKYQQQRQDAIKK